MARIIYGGLVTSIRGSIGGTTFQKNAFGYTVKNKPNMIKPNSDQQQLSKSIIAFLTTQWSTQDPLFVAAWNNFAAAFPQTAKHNVSAILSGFSVFVKRNYYYILNHGFTFEIITAPIMLPNTFIPLTATVTTSSTNIYLNINYLSGSPAVETSFFAFPNHKKTLNYVGSRFRFVGSGDNSVDRLDITDIYVKAFGVFPVIGSVVFIKAVECALASGQIFGPVIIQALVSED